MGAVGAGTHRSLIFWFLVLCAPADFGNPENRLHLHPQVQIPNAYPGSVGRVGFSSPGIWEFN